MNNFFNSYINVYRPYIHHVNVILEPYDLYAAQYRVLRDIAGNQPTTLVQVSKRSFIEKPTARKIIKKLIDFNLVQAINSKEDKREKFLTLTEKGDAMHNDIYEQVLEFQNKCFEAIGADEQELLKAEELLNQFRNYLIEEATE